MAGDPTEHIVVSLAPVSDQLGAWPAGWSALAVLKACSLKAKCRAGTLQLADGTGTGTLAAWMLLRMSRTCPLESTSTLQLKLQVCMLPLLAA